MTLDRQEVPPSSRNSTVKNKQLLMEKPRKGKAIKYPTGATIIIIGLDKLTELSVGVFVPLVKVLRATTANQKTVVIPITA